MVKINSSARYKIEIAGQLDAKWAQWFAGSLISSWNDRTIITSTYLDQSALHGLLARIRDLGCPLISLYRLEPEEGKLISGEAANE